MDFHALVARVQRHEGFRPTPYRDAEGWAIGYGRNLTVHPLTEAEAEQLLRHNLFDLVGRLSERLLFWPDLDEVRQEALIEMAYNLGVGGLMKFEKMLSALDCEDWARAAEEALDSRWARQVGKRARTLAEMLRTGERP